MAIEYESFQQNILSIATPYCKAAPILDCTNTLITKYCCKMSQVQVPIVIHGRTIDFTVICPLPLFRLTTSKKTIQWLIMYNGTFVLYLDLASQL